MTLWRPESGTPVIHDPWEGQTTHRYTPFWVQITWDLGLSCPMGGLDYTQVYSFLGLDYMGLAFIMSHGRARLHTGKLLFGFRLHGTWVNHVPWEGLTTHRYTPFWVQITWGLRLSCPMGGLDYTQVNFFFWFRLLGTCVNHVPWQGQTTMVYSFLGLDCMGLGLITSHGGLDYTQVYSFLGLDCMGLALIMSHERAGLHTGILLFGLRLHGTWVNHIPWGARLHTGILLFWVQIAWDLR